MRDLDVSNPLFTPVDEHAPNRHEVPDEVMLDPHAALKKLAGRGPVVRGIGARFGDVVLPDMWGQPPDGDSAIVLDFEHCNEVLKDTGRFSSDVFGHTSELVLGRSLFCMDPLSTRYRRILQSGFTIGKMSRWDEQIIRPTVRRVVDGIRGLGRGDLAVQCTAVFPWEIMAQILGLPEGDVDFVADRVSTALTVGSEPALAMQAAQELLAYLDEHVERTRAHPDDRFVSALLEAEADGERLTNANVRAFLMHLFPAGLETTFRGGSSMLYHLLSNPQQLRDVYGDPTLIPAVIEETLRMEGPATMMPRQATCDTTVAGVEIPKGATVFAVMASANRDSKRWADPDRFDIHRDERAHLGWGSGPHTCIGIHLARREMTALLEAAIDLLPGLAFDPDIDVPPIRGLGPRAALSLPAIWETDVAVRATAGAGASRA